MLISLTGFMCSGKSRVGRALAHRLHVPFHDLDRLIEERIGGPITPFFLREGEAAFRAVETEVLLHTVAHAEGGLGHRRWNTCRSHALMAHAQAVGPVVLLNVPYEVLVQRIRKGGSGPAAVLRCG
ncbi:MAG: hypothetical protein IPK99_11250 [Flavobacteriales bacterium]|nr:hypothetical protein [Flavobacteriales bacterium]